MYNRVVNKVQNGSIVLFHNGVENTPKALDKILAKLKADGYEFVAVGVFYSDCVILILSAVSSVLVVITSIICKAASSLKASFETTT